MSDSIDHNADEFEGRPHLVRKRARAEFWGRLVQYMTMFLLVIILVLVLVTIKTNNDDKNNLLSCTTAHGECYKQSQKQTGLLINDLVNRINGNSDQTRLAVIIALWCDGQPGLDTIPQQVRCVNERLKIYADLSIRSQETDPSGQQ